MQPRKMKVHIEKVLKLKKELRKIDSVPFSEIYWYECKEKLTIPDNIVHDFELVGLNNTDFPMYFFNREFLED